MNLDYLCVQLRYELHLLQVTESDRDWQRKTKT